MPRYEIETDSLLEKTGIAVRLLATSLGILAIIIGLMYAGRTFNLIYNAIKHPQTFQVLFDQWVLIIGGSKLDLTLFGEAYPVARIITVFVLGGGSLILVWLSIGIMMAGAKIVSWTSSEREAIKRILTYTFGPDKVEVKG